MPTYDYVCNSCKHEAEIFQSITDKPLKKCPACGRKTLKRLIGAGAGIIFRGSGFYETDYRSEAYKSDARKDKEPAASGSDAAGSGKDSSSAKKSSDKDNKNVSKKKIKAAG